MASNQSYFLVLFYLISQIALWTIGIQATESDNDQIQKDLFNLRKFNVSSAINGILNHNWLENRECLIELNAIKNGLDNDEQWAMKGRLNQNSSLI